MNMISENFIGFIIGQALVFAGVLIRIYTGQQVKNREFEIRMKVIEQRDSEIYRKIDQMASDILEVKLALKDKQTRVDRQH